MNTKRFVSLVLTICMLLALAVVAPADFGINANAAYNYSGGTRNSATFIVDPGHGGSDCGATAAAVGNSARHEADDVLRLSIAVAKLVDANGATCSLTRVTDATQSLETKVSIANSGSFTYFLSIHRNAGGGTGIETYYYSGLSASSTGAKLATAVNNQLASVGCWRNRGVKTASYYVIKYTNMAAALTEVGFMDTAADNTNFDNYFDANAKAIANGLLSMVGKSVTNGASSAKYQSCMDSPAGASKTNATVTASASVTQNGTSDNLSIQGWTVHSSGISKVDYKIDNGGYTALSTWLRTDVQSAIGGYSDYSNCGFSGTISYKNLSGGSHTVTIRATTKANTTYTVATIALTVSDPIKPTISNVQITNKTTTGYRVSCTVSDNAGISSVSFPTWTNSNSQDDIIWHEGTISGSTAYYDVKVSEHNNEQDLYITHIYAYDISGNSTSAGTSFDLTKDTEAPSVTDGKISNIDCFGFDVSANMSDNKGVTKAQVAIWTEAGGQDDLQWHDMTINGSTATFSFDISSHSNQSGFYNAHVYAWDFWGNASCYNLSATVPVPVYPTDVDYIPINAVNGDHASTDSQLVTSGTFTDVNHGVFVLTAVSGGYKVTAKYDAGVAKSIVASTSTPIVAVSNTLTGAYAAYLTVDVGDVVVIEGADVATGRVLSGAFVKIPAKFVLVDETTSVLDTQFVTVKSERQTAKDIDDEFVCKIQVVDTKGETLAENSIAGTGCIALYVNSEGVVVESAVIVIIGDISGDGVITSADSICACLLIKSTANYGEAQSLAADVNGDGTLSSLDYVVMTSLCKE